MATKPQKYADGGAMQAGLQPTMAIGYADGGQTGPWAPGLDANTTTFNQDYLRGPNFGDSSNANMITPPGGAAPASAGGGHGGQSTPYNPPANEVNPDGTANLDAQGSRINSDMGSLANSGLAKLAASLTVPGFARMMPAVVAAQGAYNLFNGLTSGDQTNGEAAPQGMNSNAFGIGRATALGQLGDFASSKIAGDPMGTFISQLDTNRPAIGAVDSVDHVGTAGLTGSGGSTDSNSQMGHTESTPSGGLSTGGFGSTASAADGGQAVPGGFNRAGQQGAMPNSPQPPGLQLPGAPTAPPAAANMHPALANLHVQNKMANPQVMQAMKTHISQAIQAGRVNPQQLQLMGQLAQSAMQHPELWPKLREFAMQAGLPDAQSLPMQFNQGMCMALLAASQAAQHGDQPGAFANGGQLHGPGSGTSDSIHAQNISTGQPVKLSNGEYIIPADVVATKGKEFFDNIVRKYHTPAAMQR